MKRSLQKGGVIYHYFQENRRQTMAMRVQGGRQVRGTSHDHRGQGPSPRHKHAENTSDWVVAAGGEDKHESYISMCCMREQVTHALT